MAETRKRLPRVAGFILVCLMLGAGLAEFTFNAAGVVPFVPGPGAASKSASSQLIVPLAGLAAVLLAVGGLAYATPKLLSQVREKSPNRWWIDVCLVLAIPYFLTSIFSLLCRHVFRLFGGFAGVPSDYTTAINQWNAFSLSWLLDTLTVNASQIGGWARSSIRASTWWSDGLVWAYCIVLDVIVLASILNVLRAVAATVQGKR